MEKNRDYNKNIFGYEVDLKKLLIYGAIYLLIIAILVIIDRFAMHVSWYGVLVGSGFLFGLGLFCVTSKTRGIKKDFPFNLICWVFPFAIVGARLYYVLFRLDYYAHQPFIESIAVWKGGLAIYGGILAGILAVFIACRVHKESFIDCLDCLAPCMILGQAIGRWGNFINQEAYGIEITNPNWQFFPFAVYIDRVAEWHLATFFIESMWCLIGCIALLVILRKTHSKGIALCSYGLIYGAERVVVEGFRTDSLWANIFGWNVRISQLLSGVIIVVSIIALITIIICNRRRNEKEHNI